MHSLETGIIVSIAAFFFLSFLAFVFLRETNMSKEILVKYETEKKYYYEGNSNNYRPEDMNNVIKIIIEEELIYGGEVED